MTKMQDFRLSESHFKLLIGKSFKKYRCDSLEYTNSVTGVVGIYIDNKTFELRNEQESIQYFDSVDDIAVWGFREVNTNDIHSFFEDTNQIDTPVDEIVNKITLVNDFPKKNGFLLDQWINGITPSVETEFISIK